MKPLNHHVLDTLHVLKTGSLSHQYLFHGLISTLSSIHHSFGACLFAPDNTWPLAVYIFCLDRLMSSTLIMPSVTTERRRSSSNTKEKFPDFDPSIGINSESLRVHEEEHSARRSARTPSPSKANGPLHSEEWQPRKDNHLMWGNGNINVAGPRQHGRQKSIGEAIRTIRTRRASVSENAHELAEALKAPLSVKLVVSTARFLVPHAR